MPRMTKSLTPHRGSKIFWKIFTSIWAASSRIAILMVTPRRPQETKHTKKERKKKRKLGENKTKQNKTKQNRTKKI